VQYQRPGISLHPTIKRLLLGLFAAWLLLLVTVVWFQWEPAHFVWRHLVLDLNLHSERSVFSGEVWQLFTYAWLHDLQSPMHLLMNCLGLFFLGNPLVQRWGTRAFLQFYVLCAVGAGVIAAVAALLVPSLFGYPVVGASGAILGLLTAFALLNRNQTFYLWMAVPVPARAMIPITIGLDVLFFLTDTRSFAIAAHLGGIFTGWLLVTGNWRLGRLRAQWDRMRRSRTRRHLRVIPPGESGRPWVH
jgi:membrane associated rhomboid family serine protease